MNPNEEAPKLPKLPFIAGDLLLVATAGLIAFRAPAPLTPVALLAIAVCVMLGAVLLVIPFLADYARRSDAELAERQNQIAALARTTADSAEQLGIVASGLNGIAESSKHNIGALEKLPAQLKTRIDDLTRQLAASSAAAHTAAREDAARLEASSEKLTRLLAKFESAAQLNTGTLATSGKDLAATLARATDTLDAFIAKTSLNTRSLAENSASASTPLPDPEPFITPEPPAPIALTETAAIIPATPVAEPVSIAPPSPPFIPSEPDPADVPVNPEPAPESPKPPRARKPKPEDDIPDLGLTPDAPEASESSVTSDGFTRLVATAYIGIGNKLYVRGDGPGLSWDKGVPLQFVSIGKWRWETPDATAPVRVKLYKNDQLECQGLGTLTLEPGRQHEVNAGF
jgi:hypothetical protein